MTPTVVGVNGSRRRGSYTRLAVGLALEAAADAGAETDLVDLGTADLPLYHPDEGDRGEAAELKRRVRGAEGVIVGSPVYHGSFSSAFKNFHDYCGYDEYDDTVVGLVAVAGGGSYASTLDHLRITIRGVHGLVVPRQVGIRNASDRFDAAGELTDVDIGERLETLGRDVVRHARRARRPVDPGD